MRLLLAAPLLLLPLNVFADPDALRTATPPARVDPRTPADTGQLRSAQVAAPDAVAVRDDAPPRREHAVAPPHIDATAATDGDVVAELAAHQMKRHLRALDGCVAAAHKRAPAAAGTITLDFDVADRKVKSVHVADDGVHDTELAACLTTAASRFTFALASARFRWPVALHP